MSLLITQQEMVLIKNSEEAKNTSIYGNFYDCLEQYSKLSHTTFKKNIVFDKKARAVISNNKLMLIDNIKKEWYSTKYCENTGIKIRCQLCGTPNTRIHYIHNRINGKELNIGCECVKKFKDIDGLDISVKNFKAEEKERLRQQRKIEFESFELDDVNFISEAENYFSSFPILLPYNIYNNIKETIYNLNLVKTSYINSGGEEVEVIEKFNTLKYNFQELASKATKFYNKFQNHPLICKKYLADWIFNNDHYLWEDVSKNNGLINCDALKYIYLPEYLTEKLSMFQKCLVDKEIKILGIDKTSVRFIIKNKRYPTSITFTVSIKEFMKKIGCYCLTDETFIFTRKDLVNVTIEETKNNFNTIYNSIYDLLSKYGYDFIIEDKSDQAYWKQCARIEAKKSKWSNHNINENALYRKSSISKLLTVISSYFLLDASVLEDNFTIFKKKMESGSVCITQFEKDRNAEIVAEARGLQKRKEYVLYK